MKLMILAMIMLLLRVENMLAQEFVGYTQLNDQALEDIKIIGSAKISNSTFRNLEIIGAVEIENVKVQNKLNIIGPILKSKTLNAPYAEIAGSFQGDNILIEHLKVAGDIHASNSIFKKLEFTGDYINLVSSKVERLKIYSQENGSEVKQIRLNLKNSAIEQEIETIGHNKIIIFKEALSINDIIESTK
ncbi:hypothetical protein [Rickettsiales endosymbiont of Stachyamoeba lipophora]|uniref:hypothetical protein n=1 Tax=Rickettsiales endosymbiont of Stachyamoeba lipophora TaxID=2486578 RepID=UPI000F649105|nr:hypothetical protein [Rickettsiales endosymbiont of Stachyamoeba lipophora]AZL15739.1 hypothetical protein EF513_04160 [Rickettsiales endosymbiont of Stachyamoeba lipophora]